MPDGLVAFLNARYDEIGAGADAAINEKQTGRWRVRDHDSNPWLVVDEGEDHGPIAYDEGNLTDAQAWFIAKHDPASVLLDLEAKRAVLAVHRPRREALQDSSCHAPEACDGCGTDIDYGPNVEHTDDCPTLRALAIQFRTHPEYLAGWAIQEA